jgi:hypothetical protein
MVNPSRANALKRRALNTAKFLENWANLLQTEAKKQNVEIFPLVIPKPKYGQLLTRSSCAQHHDDAAVKLRQDQ